jgi:tripartite-type tricarboxylate transporter receptor subunit TctC
MPPTWNTSRITLAIVGGLALGVAHGAVAAEPFPAKPIEIIVPTPPGGGTDIATRLLAEVTEPILGHKLVVVNKPGGGGTVGVATITQAKPDGYTLGSIWNAPMTMTPHSLQVPYALDDYVPISQITAAPLVYCTKPDFPANNGKEFIEAARKNPGKLTYGNDGVGGTVQLAGERIFRTQGVQLRPVPFGGAGETLKAFLGGHVDIYGGSIPPILPHVKAGKAKCLLLTSRERSDTLPGAASLTDLGVPQAATVLWRGVIGPKGLPADRVAILEKAFRQGAQAPKFQEFAAKQGEQAVGSSAAAFAELIRAEYQAFAQIVKDLGLGKR